MKKNSSLVLNALIACLYVVLTLVPLLIPSLGTFLYGTIQFRLSEMLMIFPFFIKNSYYGLFIGCALANYIGMSFGFTMPIDIIIGSLATLLAGYLVSKIKIKALVPIPTILVNAVIIGLMLTLLFPIASMPIFLNFMLYAFQIGVGEAAVCYGLGLPLLNFLEKRGFNEKGLN